MARSWTTSTRTLLDPVDAAPPQAPASGGDAGVAAAVVASLRTRRRSRSARLVLQRRIRHQPILSVYDEMSLVGFVITAVDAIPFTDLPRIDGTELLRGFAHDRFRDQG